MLAGQPADRKCLALADADCGRYEERAGGERGRPTLGRGGVLRCHRYCVAKAVTLASPDNTKISGEPPVWPGSSAASCCWTASSSRGHLGWRPVDEPPATRKKILDSE